MAKKTDANQYPGCLGTACSDGTCLACQVSQSERHHEEVVAAVKDLGAHIGDIATELTSLRRTLGAPAAAAAVVPRTPASASASASAPAPAATPAVSSAPNSGSGVATLAAPVAPEPAPLKALTIEVVRPAILEWVKANGRDKLVAALAEFGATKLPDIKDADLQRLVDRLGVKV